MNGLVVFDGSKRLATLGDRELIVWDMTTGRPDSSCVLPPPPKALRGARLLYPTGWGVSATADGAALMVVRGGSGSVYKLPLGKNVPVSLPQPPKADDALVAVVPAGKDKGDTVLGVSAKGAILEWRSGDKEWTAVQSPALGDKPTVAYGGGIIAIVEKQSRVHLWDTGKGKSLGMADVDRNQGVAITADAKRLITIGAASEGETAEVRSIPDCKIVSRWKVPDLVSAVAISADGSLAATGHSSALDRGQNQVNLYEVATGKLRSILPVARGATHLAFLSDGGLVTAGEAGVLQIWDTATGKPRHPSPGHLGGVVAVVPAPDGGWVSAGADGVAISWDSNGKETNRFNGHKGTLTGLVLAGDGKILYSAGADGTIRQWDVGNGKERRSYLIENGSLPIRSINALAISPDGKRLAAGVWGGGIRLLDTNLKVTKVLVPKLDVATTQVLAITFASNELLVSRDSRRAIRVWNTTGEGHLLQMSVSGGSALASARLSLSPNGKTAASPIGPSSATPSFGKSTPATEVGLWDIENGKLLERVQTAANTEVTAVTYLPDGKAVVVGDAAGAVRVIDLTTKKVRHTFTGHRGPVLCLSASPDGKMLASGGADTTVLIWKLDKP